MASLRNVRQDKETKDNIGLDVSIINLLKYNKVSRKDLREIMSLTDSIAREEVRKIALFYPVISYTGSDGYSIVNTKEITEENYLETIYEINKTIAEQQSRIKVLKKRMKPLIACKKVLEKKFGRKENE